MPKAKAKVKEKVHWTHFHKIEVHKNRWLIWAISLSVVICAALIGYIQVTGVYFEAQMFGNETQGPTWMTFSHKSYGYSLRYPRAWAVEAEDMSTISFVNTHNANEYFSITVYPLSEREEVEESLFVTTEKKVYVAGRDAVMVSQSADQAEDVVMLVDGDDLFVLRGKAGVFERMVDSFKFSQKLERV